MDTPEPKSPTPPRELTDEEYNALTMDEKMAYLRQLGFREITDLEGWGMIGGIPPKPKS